MTRFKHYRSGGLYGIQYWFDAMGDGIPEHAHDEELLHNIIVLEGTVVFATAERARALTAGTVFDFDGKQRHKITALGKASVLHLFLNGIPNGYDGLPESELEGVLA